MLNLSITSPKRDWMNNKGKIRKLAAIMFMDMVGFTALMQENEQLAIRKRNRNRAVLRREVKAHQGEILQYFGDGCLCLFNSAAEAVKAAVNIQREMRAPLKVPVRIGIHLGDVTKDEEGLYGDSVNVASRIESMSVPFAVLISDRVQEQIKNQKDLKCRSLGHFKLKNVKRQMEIFALDLEGLAVPEPHEMQGKGEAVSGDGGTSKSVIQYLKPIGILSAVMLLLLFLKFGLPDENHKVETIKPSDKIVYKGVVVRTSDLSPLPGALLIIDNGRVQAHTDDVGRFELPLDTSSKIINLEINYNGDLVERMTGMRVSRWTLDSLKVKI